MRRQVPGRPARHRLATVAVAMCALLALAACGSSEKSNATRQGTKAPPATPEFKNETLTISGIPDQDPEKLNRLHGGVASYLADALGVEVEYVPVVDYTAAVSSFRLGDLDAVWFGGLTGVQARLQTPGAKLVAQRDIDAEFQSVFIANTSANLDPIAEVGGLDTVKGHSVTFGSESSTSGRLMPQYFLDQAGVTVDDLEGQPGFSGSHDATIELVEAGTFEVGALNRQVWETAVAAGTVDPSTVEVIFETPTYADYHWLARPNLDTKFGPGFTRAFQNAILGLDLDVPEQAAVLELFAAERFIPTEADNYARIEAIGRKLGLIN